jgi:CheY-like chemotaxis protein
LVKEAYDAGANKCVSKMDCTPNLALEIVEQIFSGEILGLYPQPLGNSAIPASMPPPPTVHAPRLSKTQVEEPPTLSQPTSPAAAPTLAPTAAPSSLPRLVIPPSPPKFSSGAPAPVASEKLPFTAPLIKMPALKPTKTILFGDESEGVIDVIEKPMPTTTPVISGMHAPKKPASVAASPTPPSEEAMPAAPDFGSDATSVFRLEIRQEFLKRVPQIQADLRERVGALVRSKSTTEQLALLQGFNTSISSLVGLAGVTGFTRIAHLAGAMEALVKDLQRKPKQMTGSVMRSIAHASDCLNVLFHDIHQGGQEFPRSMLILAVDDEPIARRTIAVALAKANLRCICVEEAKMAMTVLIENQFDLIFLDAEMPEMNGFELCAGLRKTATNKATPVIFVTSLTNFEVRAQSSLAGANDLIAKPFLMMELAVKSLTYLLRPKSILDTKGQAAGK